MADLTIDVQLLERWQGDCTQCGEPADTDRQTVAVRFLLPRARDGRLDRVTVRGRRFRINDKGVMHFHQICAWKRMTFIFGELF